MVIISDGKLRKGCALKKQSLAFDLYKAFDFIEISQKSDSLYPKRPIAIHTTPIGALTGVDLIRRTNEGFSRQNSLILPWHKSVANFSFIITRTNCL